MVITIDATLKHWAFYFQGFGLPLSFSGAWSDSMNRVDVAQQELQAFALVLHRIAFHIFCKVTALHLGY